MLNFAPVVKNFFLLLAAVVLAGVCSARAQEVTNTNHTVVRFEVSTPTLRCGATSLAAVATHALLPGDSLQKLQASGLFTAIVCTDSHPRALELQPRGLEVAPIAHLFLPYL